MEETSDEDDDEEMKLRAEQVLACLRRIHLKDPTHILRSLLEVENPGAM